MPRAPGTQKTSPPASHPLGLINFPKGLGHGSVPDLALKGFGVCRLACGDDEAVVFNPDGFNLRRQLEFISIGRRVEQLMDDAVEGHGWDG